MEEDISGSSCVLYMAVVSSGKALRASPRLSWWRVWVRVKAPLERTGFGDCGVVVVMVAVGGWGAAMLLRERGRWSSAMGSS